MAVPLQPSGKGRRVARRLIQVADLGRENVAVPRLGLEDPAQPRLALALAILRGRVEISDAGVVSCFDDCIGAGVAHPHKALSQRRPAEAEVRNLDIGAPQAPPQFRIHALPPNVASTRLARSYTLKSYTI